MADDLGYADVVLLRPARSRTPNIDRLAAEGVRFLQAYANSAVCSATRTALITGRYQYRLRARPRRAARTGRATSVCRPSTRRCRRCCKKAGYGTTLVGKWHLGALPNVRPAARAATTISTASAAAPSTTTRTHGTDQKEDLWDDDVPVQQTGYLTELLGDRAVDVDQRATRSRGSRSSSASTSTRRTGRGKRPATRRSRSADPRRTSVDLRRRLAEDLSAHDPGDGSRRSAAFCRRSMRTA